MQYALHWLVTNQIEPVALETMDDGNLGTSLVKNCHWFCLPLTLTLLVAAVSELKICIFVLGTIAVICSFPFIFNKCIRCGLCESDATYDSIHVQPCWVQFIYYAPFVAVFQFGWASTQISHLSLIPEITRNKSEIVELNAIRLYINFVCVNLVCIAYIGKTV